MNSFKALWRWLACTVSLPLLVMQAWITWNARKISEPAIRRALVQAYFVCFALTTLALLRAQLTEGGNLNRYVPASFAYKVKFACQGLFLNGQQFAVAGVPYIRAPALVRWSAGPTQMLSCQCGLQMELGEHLHVPKLERWVRLVCIL